MDDDDADDALVDDLPEDALLVGQVEIVRYLTRDGDIVIYRAVDGNGDDLPLTEALGLLAVAEHSAVLDWQHR